MPDGESVFVDLSIPDERVEQLLPHVGTLELVLIDVVLFEDLLSSFRFDCDITSFHLDDLLYHLWWQVVLFSQLF